MATTPLENYGKDRKNYEYNSALDLPDVPSVQQEYSALADKRRTEDTPEFTKYDVGNRPDVTSSAEFEDPNALVSIQLDKLLDSDSSYMKRAEAKALENMNKMGLLNSSIAIGASQAAAIDAALPIAQRDAETYRKLKENEQLQTYKNIGTEYEAAVSSDLRQQQATNDAIAKKYSDAWAIDLKGLDQQTQVALNDLQSQWNYVTQDAMLKANKYLQKMKVSADSQKAFNQRAEDLLNNYQISIQQLLSSPEFLDNFGGDRQAMNRLFNDMFQTAVSAITFDAQALGTYTPDMQNYLQNLKVSAQW